ncbi:MAG: hypothetical protein M1299_07475 [Firmicutes bacterium]|nr:hypothetical protein [Bacillota bacterium]MCL5039643.1 hypothetical protein [Bacillota bacterium]
MGKYGEAAIMATKLAQRGVDPREAWDIATTEIFGRGSAAQDKGCPRGAYLGLCEEGLVKGVVPGKYTNSIKNKNYAIRALEALKREPALSKNQLALWDEVTGGGKVHNQQIDVVISLWNEHLLW